jgi:hypothetical protein
MSQINAPYLRGRPPGLRVMNGLGMQPDPWQVDVLESKHPRLLLCCCRQAGKSTVVAILGLAEAVFVPGTKVLLVSRSHRQSRELFRLVTDFYGRLGSPMKKRQTQEELELSSGSRVVCVPCREDTIRGYAHINLLVLDEAARVPDDLYRAVRPMLAVSNGRMICLSTPYGKRGFFYDAWANGAADWQRIQVPADKVPRISAAFLDEERRALGESWFRQEYQCQFQAFEGLVYPDFDRCVVEGPAPAGRRWVGGIDFGFRNPFAAIWGVVDGDDVLWLSQEIYERGKSVSDYAGRLPKQVHWYADPSGASERYELIRANRKVLKGNNEIRPGIAAVTARLEAGMLKVVEGTCPNLLREADLYRYGDGHDETPLDEHNHALAALRYLISGLDGNGAVWRRRRRKAEEGKGPATPQTSEATSGWSELQKWLSVHNPYWWHPSRCTRIV